MATKAYSLRLLCFFCINTPVRLTNGDGSVVEEKKKKNYRTIALVRISRFAKAAVHEQLPIS